MNENDKHFIKRYEELLDKGYCNCNEMNCIDNNSPRRILNIVNNLQSKIDKAIEYCEYNDEGLYTFEPDYDYEENIVDNYEPSNFREDIMEILKEDK